jgi:hypothetical protein
MKRTPKRAVKRGGRKAKLLAGGNPQIAKADGEAPVRKYIDAMPGWKRSVGLALDSVMTREAPQVIKAVKWNSPFYGLEGRGWFLSFHCFTQYIKVTFFNGASLRPLPPEESKHNMVRYLHIGEGEKLDEKQLSAWVNQALELPGWMP